MVSHLGCAARDPAVVVEEACCEAARRGKAEGTNAYVCVSTACKAANTAVALANMADTSANSRRETKQIRSCYDFAPNLHTDNTRSLSLCAAAESYRGGSPTHFHVPLSHISLTRSPARPDLTNAVALLSQSTYCCDAYHETNTHRNSTRDT